MDYQDKIQWLWRYRGALRKENELRLELEQCRKRALGCGAAMSGMPKSAGDGQSLPRMVESIIRAQQELEAQINQCGATRREIVEVINQCDGIDHEILRRRYLLGQRWWILARDMHLSERHARRLGREAVERLKIIH